MKKVYGEQGVKGLSFFHVDQDNRLNDLTQIPKPKTNEGDAAKPEEKQNSLSVSEAIEAILHQENDDKKDKQQ